MRTYPSTRTVRRRPLTRLAAGTVAAAVLLIAAGCSGDTPKWYSADGKPAESSKPPAVTFEVTGLTDGATNVPTALEIAYTTDAATSTIELSDAGGAAVPGDFRADKSSWVPAQQLKWSSQYTLKLSGSTADGKSETKSISFTTMAKPGSTAKASSVIGDGQVVGVAMPIIVSFSSEIAKDQRANVQKRLFITSEPAQEGIWYWWNNKEVHFRPKEYWQAGTKLNVRAAIGGLLLGGNRYGAADLTIKASVGPKLVMVADNANKQMTVTRDGQLLRTIPVSFGKPSSPSASGNMMVMIKNPWEWFDSSTFGTPVDSPDGYRTKVHWPQRLTWDGEYVHAAPWSEKDQGKRNVSHGCTNISMPNAEWLYQQTHIGDPVIIKGTEQRVKWQNGWTHWEKPWAEYIKGSAIPYSPPAPPSVPSGDPGSPAPSTPTN
jgi:lipoprotein-anchoring transpeptidase ErfK/SrfK